MAGRDKIYHIQYKITHKSDPTKQMPETHHEFLPGTDAKSVEKAFEEGRQKEIEGGLSEQLEGAYVWVSSCTEVNIPGVDIMLYPEVDRSGSRSELRSTRLFPDNVYIRLIRVGHTEEPQVDMFKAFGDPKDLHHVMPVGSFPLVSAREDVKGYRSGDEALCDRVLDLVRKVRKETEKD